MFIVLFLLVIAGAVVYRATTPEDRARWLEQVQPLAARMDDVVFVTEPFRAELRARTPRVVLTPVLAGLNVLVFLAMLFGDGAFGESATLLDWGASSGPRTTNGEWWRLVTALFAQGGPSHLLFILVGLLQVGELLERLVGAAIVGCVYVTAGMVASLVSIVDHPLAVHAGASAAVYGLYGLLLAVTGVGMVRGRGLTIPLAVFQTLVPASVLFFLYTFVTDGVASRPNLTGLVVGVVGGLALTMKVGEQKPALRPLAIAMVVATALMIAIAWPLRGIVDVRPDLVELVASEDRKATVFRGVVARFTSRQVPIDRSVLVGVIDTTILPQLITAREHVGALDNALANHQPLVASAAEYLRLREQSWRLRAEGLRKGKMVTLREAETIERAALDVLKTLRGVKLTIEVYT